MAAVNQGRVWLGALVAGFVWWIWSSGVRITLMSKAYARATEAGQILPEARYKLFPIYWLLTLILLSAVIARFYAHMRQTMGPGPNTALKVGLMVGFAAGFPLSFSAAAWSPMDRVIPLSWVLDMWAGSCISALISGWFYKER